MSSQSCSFTFHMQSFNLGGTIMSYFQTVDSRFPIVKQSSDYTEGNYSNQKLSFLFWDECCFDAWRHGYAMTNQNLPLSGFSVFPPSEKVCISCSLVTRSTWPQSLCSSGSDSPRRENLPKPQLLSDHARPHCSLSPDHPSKLPFLLTLHIFLSPPFPLLSCLFLSPISPIPKSSQMGQIYSGRCVAGRSPFFSLGGQQSLTVYWSGLAD